MKRRRLAYAILLFWPWFTAPYFNWYYPPWGSYFHPTGPCYGVGCPAHTQGEKFHYPKH